ncbi:MAG: hypothetical protein E3K32_10450 [wastewater metagenome]|nr:hypothetical protein [Candidatus Loosdrechtia aerotolerans]
MINKKIPWRRCFIPVFRAFMSASGTFGLTLKRFSGKEVLKNIHAGDEIIQGVEEEKEKTKDPSPFIPYASS